MRVRQHDAGDDYEEGECMEKQTKAEMRIFLDNKMCDQHRLQWGNLYHQYLHQHFQMPWGYQQLVQMPWEYQQQYPCVRPITLHLANDSQCHRSARVPSSLCANESLCHCCPALSSSRTCCIYANKGPYHCCTNGPLPVNTRYTSPLRCYPRRHPAMIEPYVPSRYARGFKNTDKYESSSEDEDGEDSSEDSSDDEADSSSDSHSNNEIPTLSECEEFLRKKRAEIMKKEYIVGDRSLDNVPITYPETFSKYEQDFINDRAEQLLKQYKGEDYSDSVPSNQWSGAKSFAIYEQVLAKIHDQLTEEDKEKEGFSFKIIDEPRDRPIFDSDDEDASDEDSDDESYEEYTDEEESSDEDKDEKDPSGEVEDVKSEERAEPRYGVEEVQHRVGRMSLATLEDKLLEQELK